ncbi:MAG: DUF1786 domain-containing protein [Chloroflexota bacterium]
MRILTIDVGTGTQDILVFDADRELENCVKMVMPSPTAVIAQRIRATTELGTPLLLDGVTMGGGPSHWAAMDHVRAGYPVYATPDAARTFDDDLEGVAGMGITVVSEDEAARLTGVERVTLRDLWIDEVRLALRTFGADDRFDALAVAVFDHGAAPPGYSDRIFRFDYLAERVRQSADLTVFAFPREAIPASLTRLRAVAASVDSAYPLLVMDTAPAAVLGALDDPTVARESAAIVANVGNFHCLAFRLEGGRIAGLFEHHTGELSKDELEMFLDRLIDGTITNQEVFDDMGHGALMFQPPGRLPGPDGPFLAITGPRRGILDASRLRPYLAVPHGDMMLAGCFGLLRAYAAHDAAVAEAVTTRLGPRPGV